MGNSLPSSPAPQQNHTPARRSNYSTNRASDTTTTSKPTAVSRPCPMRNYSRSCRRVGRLAVKDDDVGVDQLEEGTDFQFVFQLQCKVGWFHNGTSHLAASSRLITPDRLYTLAPFAHADLATYLYRSDVKFIQNTCSATQTSANTSKTMGNTPSSSRKRDTSSNPPHHSASTNSIRSDDNLKSLSDEELLKIMQKGGKASGDATTGQHAAVTGAIGAGF
ncbi:hypothetical protein HDV05_002723 [Chytridiales sp. JEL 0842]|nr:hypothetical protein HDV05_002723 [Chytridiales sp. JEL 0842]